MTTGTPTTPTDLAAGVAGLGSEEFQKIKASNPSLANQLVKFMLNESPSEPITATSDPLYFDANKNPGTYHYVPKKGIGFHKEGSKMHAFEYDVSFHTRSKDFFGKDIETAKTAEDIHSLADVIVAAFSDLVFNGNDDMTSYLYLMQQATFVLSEEVKNELENNGIDPKNGGIALGLVTELVATGSKDALFKKAVQPRIDASNLQGMEALNEASIQKVYIAITPAVQTQGILLNNGIDISEGWAPKLIQSAPSLDKLVAMDFSEFQKIINDEKGADELPISWENAKKFLKAPTGEELVAYKMYAGLLGTPDNITVPPIRGHLLEQGISPWVANVMEQQGNQTLSSLDDKEIYKNASDIIASLGGGNLALTENGSIDVNQYLREGLMHARQTSIMDKAEEKIDGSGYSLARNTMGVISSLGTKVRGVAGLNVSSVGGVTSGVLGKLGGIGAAAGGMAGAGAAVASTLAAVAGPIAVAVALAPLVKAMAADMDRQLDQGLAEVGASREKIESEVRDLLASVDNLTIEEDAAKQKQLAEQLLNKIRNPNALTFSSLQGMGLQKKLEALGTSFNPTNMASLVPYTSDAELVAAVDSGRALSALALLMDPENVTDTPDRQLLQTPKYVSMMGPSTPFYTRTSRSTSEDEMTSFITSSKQSGFSTAQKASRTKSGSAQGGVNFIGFGAKVKGSGSQTSKTELSKSYATDTQQKEEERVKVTQAIVAEYMYVPIKTFRLMEGGLILTQYAYYRLQRILKDVDNDGKTITDATLVKVMRRKKAYDFLCNFGSHIPFGIQTLGGVHIRTMKITSEGKQKLSEMYSTASARLTKTKSEASKVDTSTSAKLGLFGGAEAATSGSVSNAASSGVTISQGDGKGSGTGESSLNASFESNVISFGPNAATPDDCYQQVMSNNATWTIIDRGEPDSYFAIWDLIDYMGQGSILNEHCRLLKEVWEENALTNSYGNGSAELLESVMPDYTVKKQMIDFVQGLIYCLAPIDGNSFNSDLAQQFKEVVTKGFVSMSSKLSSTPAEFIEEGYNNLKQSCAADDVVPLKFEVVSGNIGYATAKKILADSIDITAWSTSFKYFTNYYTNIILKKAEPDFLVQLCHSCHDNSSNNTDSTDTSWNLVKKLIEHGLQNVENREDLREAMMVKDVTNIVKLSKDGPETTSNHCLQYVLKANDLHLLSSAWKACRSNDVTLFDNKNVKDDTDEVTSGEDPRETIQKNITLYGNLKDYTFPNFDKPATSEPSDDEKPAPLKYGDVIYLQNNHTKNRWLTVGASYDTSRFHIFNKDYTTQTNKASAKPKYQLILRSSIGNGIRDGNDPKTGNVLKYGEKIFLQFNHEDQSMLCIGGGKTVNNRAYSGDEDLYLFTWTLRSEPGSGSTTNKDRRAGREVWDRDIIHLQCNTGDKHWIYGQSSVSTQISTSANYKAEWIMRKTIGNGRLLQPSKCVHVDFADLTSPSNTHPPQFRKGAETLSCSSIGYDCEALRISKSGPYVLILDADIGPTAMPECTLMMGIRLNSLAPPGEGWVFGNYNGGFDRHIVMHGSPWGGAVGSHVGVSGWQPYIKPESPPLHEWLHVAAVFVQGGRCCVYVNGVRSDNSATGNNREGGSKHLWVGRKDKSNTGWCDCWMKHVTVIDTALTDSEVGAYSTKFFEEMEELNLHTKTSRGE